MESKYINQLPLIANAVGQEHFSVGSQQIQMNALFNVIITIYNYECCITSCSSSHCPVLVWIGIDSGAMEYSRDKQCQGKRRKQSGIRDGPCLVCSSLARYYGHRLVHGILARSCPTSALDVAQFGHFCMLSGRYPLCGAAATTTTRQQSPK